MMKGLQVVSVGKKGSPSCLDSVRDLPAGELGTPLLHERRIGLAEVRAP